VNGTLAAVEAVEVMTTAKAATTRNADIPIGDRARLRFLERRNAMAMMGAKNADATMEMMMSMAGMYVCECFGLLVATCLLRQILRSRTSDPPFTCVELDLVRMSSLHIN
jgi:hypothetical protein